MEQRKDKNNGKDKQINIRFNEDEQIYYKFAMSKPNTTYYIKSLIDRDMKSDADSDKS